MRLLSSLSRRQRRLLVAGALCMAAVLGAGEMWWLAKSALVADALAAAGARIARAGTEIGFTVENVSVEGRERESRQAILDALGVKRGSAILGLDLEAARQRIEALPWVRGADVERLLPDTLFVHLVERHPLALWQRQGKLVLVADDGAVVATDKLETYGALLVLVGDDAPKLGAPLLDLLASEPALFPHVAAAVRVGGRRWNLRMDSGIDVALPELDPAGAWHRLAALDRAESLLARNILAVDLRLPDRLVVKLPPEPPKPKKGKAAGKST